MNKTTEELEKVADDILDNLMVGPYYLTTLRELLREPSSAMLKSYVSNKYKDKFISVSELEGIIEETFEEGWNKCFESIGKDTVGAVRNLHNRALKEVKSKYIK